MPAGRVRSFPTPLPAGRTGGSAARRRGSGRRVIQAFPEVMDVGFPAGIELKLDSIDSTASKLMPGAGM